MVDSTEGEAVGPAAAEVGDVNILCGEKTETITVTQENQGVKLKDPTETPAVSNYLFHRRHFDSWCE